jgi:hypothetical protein
MDGSLERITFDRYTDPFSQMYSLIVRRIAR